MLHAPDIYAWSGKQTLGTTLGKTRAAGEVVFRTEEIPDAVVNWNGEWWDGKGIALSEAPADAIEITPENYYNVTLEENGVYVLTGKPCSANDEGGVDLENNALLNLADIPSGAKVYVTGDWLIGVDEGEFAEQPYPELHICQGANVWMDYYEEAPALIKNVTIYNDGWLKILNSYTVEGDNRYETINDGCTIYNTGTLVIETNENQHPGKQPSPTNVVCQPIYSSGTVISSGHLELNCPNGESHFMQLCVDGDLTLTAGTDIECGILNADQIHCEANATINMAADGLIVSGTFDMQEGSEVTTVAGAEPLASILTNNILGERLEDQNGGEAWGFKELNENNFSSIFHDINIFVTHSINNSIDKEAEAYQPGEKGRTMDLDMTEFDANEDDTFQGGTENDVVQIACGEGYRYLPVIDDEPEEENSDEPANEPEEENGDEPGQSDDNEDDTPSVVIPTIEHNNEVEVNLSIADSHDNNVSADLASKLSIHVRKGTDVRITMPIPDGFICASDDFAIVLKHEEGYMAANKESESVTYTINDTWTVTLTVTWGDNEIVVETDGITQELIDYLFEQNGDGINFEVWNYFETEYVDEETGEVKARPGITREKLKECLDQSTIEFLDEDPDYYINAFHANKQSETDIEKAKDCTVSIVSEQINNYDYHYEGSHLNGADWNQIYVRNGVKADNAHTAHPTDK